MGHQTTGGEIWQNDFSSCNLCGVDCFLNINSIAIIDYGSRQTADALWLALSGFLQR